MKKISGFILTVLLLQFGILSVSAQTLIANDFEKSTPKDTTLSFSSNDFTQNATPPAGAQLVSIRFNQVTNPTAGNLKIGANTVQKGNTVSVGDLDRLTFVPTAGYEGEAIFTWTANYGSAQSPYPGAVVITIGSGAATPSDISKDEVPENKTEENAQKPTSDGKNNKTEIVAEEKTENKIPDSKNNQTPKPATQENKTDSSGLKPLKYEDMLTHWGAYSAGMLASRGYVIGEDYGSHFYFRPDEKITRFEFVLMVNAIFGVEPADSLANCPFSDKNVPSYVMRVGAAAYEYDVIAGSKGTDGRLYFNPYEPITRAEAITIIDYALRLDSYGVDEAEFADKNAIPDWAMQSVRNLEAYGIIQGYEDNTLRPNVKITRAQAAEMVWQALKFLDLKRNHNAVFKTIIYGD